MHSVAMGHMTGPRVQSMGMSPNHFAWGRDHFHDRFHHGFHNRFFAFGFGGPYLYDYAYNSCWTRVPTRYGWPGFMFVATTLTKKGDAEAQNRLHRIA
jgi:hypothetical protein